MSQFSSSYSPVLAYRSNSGSRASEMAPLFQNRLHGVQQGSLLQNLIPCSRFNAPHLVTYWSMSPGTPRRSLIGISDIPCDYLAITLRSGDIYRSHERTTTSEIILRLARHDIGNANFYLHLVSTTWLLIH